MPQKVANKKFGVLRFEMTVSQLVGLQLDTTPIESSESVSILSIHREHKPIVATHTWQSAREANPPTSGPLEAYRKGPRKPSQRGFDACLGSD